MRRTLGMVLVLIALPSLAVGGLWAFMKASGAEVDFCEGGSCVSGWYPAATLLVVGFASGLAGLTLLRARSDPS